MSVFTQTIPQTIFQMRVHDKSIGGDNPYRWQATSSASLFNSSRVIIFALPGAFTPTCSSTHVPRFEELYQEFLSEGFDEVYCLSVNDAFVMNQWGRHVGVKNLKLLPDGNGDFTRKMGMLVDKNNLGFGRRSWRYSMSVNKGMIEKIFVEPGFEDDAGADPFEVSDADTMLGWIRGENGSSQKPERLAFHG